MSKWCFVVSILLTFQNVICSPCDRPKEIADAENTCSSKNPDKKCDYHYCVFDEMDLINPTYDVPCIERTSNWIKKNVVNDNQSTMLLERAQNCTGELAHSMKLGTYFFADNVDIPPEDHVTTQGDQSKCEVAAEYMKCLAKAEKNAECAIFQYS